ncbi:alpha/beta hydrolase [Actinoplanes missouriensis]|nr:alpha/beta hydrolase [Actinoplanes missouriensis]
MTITTMEYGGIDGFRPLLLDLHLPEPAEVPPPIVVFVHGGGWRRGSRQMFCPTWRDWQPGPFARLVAEGFAVASVDYRLSAEALFPAQLDDVTAAVGWLRAHAGELGVDAGRIVAWGESAGGHLAALLGLTVPGLAGVVDWYGPSDLRSHRGERELQLIGSPDRAAQASPVTHVHPGAPPFHLAHGTADQLVPVSQSEQLTAALRASAVPVDLKLISGAGHLWVDAPDPEAIFAAAVRFTHAVTDA